MAILSGISMTGDTAVSADMEYNSTYTYTSGKYTENTNVAGASGYVGGPYADVVGTGDTYYKKPETERENFSAGNGTLSNITPEKDQIYNQGLSIVSAQGAKESSAVPWDVAFKNTSDPLQLRNE